MPTIRRRTRAGKHAPEPRPLHPFDRMYGTDTGGLIPRRGLLTGHAHDAYLTAYYAVAPSILDALVQLWLGSQPAFSIDHYTFLDIGAGKGRAMMAASLHPFLEVVGIELNPGLAAIARANLEAFRQRASVLAPARLEEGDALASALPSTPTLAFLFHPFEAPLMRSLVWRLENHYRGPAGGILDLLYVNAEHAPVVDRSACFERLFYGSIPMSAEDYLADRAEIAEQKEYGSTGDEVCALYRFRPL